MAFMAQTNAPPFRQVAREQRQTHSPIKLWAAPFIREPPGFSRDQVLRRSHFNSATTERERQSRDADLDTSAMRVAIDRGRCARRTAVNDRTRMADGAVAVRALRFPVADRTADAVVATDFVVSEDRTAARQVADDAARFATAMIGAGG